MFLDIIGNSVQSKSVTFSKGDRVFIQGSEVDKIYLITSGRVKLVRENLEGNSIVIHTAYAGESFAEASLFSNEYHCYCVVDCDCELLSYSKKDVLEFLQHQPSLMMTLIENLTGQIRDLRLLGEIKSIYSAQDRIMAFLHFKANKGIFYYAYSLTDLAQKIGLAQETLYRNLKSLEDDGRIIKQKGIIKLVDMI